MIWERVPGALWRRLPDRVLVLPDDRDDPVACAGMAAAVWEVLADPATAGQVTAEVAEALGLGPTAVADDVRGALAALAEAGAVRPVDG